MNRPWFPSQVAGLAEVSMPTGENREAANHQVAASRFRGACLYCSAKAAIHSTIILN
ncbi:hypothetical protein K4H28_13495 [Deefgea tanakiae]|uniref:Uncharacterized protein n=1 Tax=Deefgea tanakiae TaxID=2865840 RepID=A0ABX8Z3X4_9NEIS|nr:hypothetical protein [Deefgea tanakiae]QZA77286.1 hypothetical protein K4H28_13495 [Deefgea tanakiae]